MKIWLLILFLCCAYPWSSTLQAQDFEVVAGPIYGHYTDSTRHFWMALSPSVPTMPFAEWLSTLNADLYRYFREEHHTKVVRVKHSHLVLEQYVLIQGIVTHDPPIRSNKNLSFLVGSCAFPYPFLFWKEGDRTKIFEVMEQHEKDFMVWMGDNVYYLNGEWRNSQRMHQKNLRMRRDRRLHNFLQSCPQYATWDDHDYGPNNAHSNCRHKYQSLEVFNHYWSNPYAGLDTVPGVFCHFRQGDAEFFLLDSRFHATDTTMLGAAQLEWLQNGLRRSTANFKFVVSGTQLLPTNPSGEDWGDFGTEREQFLDFLQTEAIGGVILLSGDRHYGELLELEREGTYPIYELTSSPLTSLINPGYTKDNPLRQAETLTLEPNFGKVELLGSQAERRCRLSMFGRDGQLLWQEEILLSDLGG